MSRSLGRRLLRAAAAVAVTALMIPVWAGPAAAAAPARDMAVSDVTVAAGTSTLVAPVLYSDPESVVTGLTMVYQLSGGLDGVELSAPDENTYCTGAGSAKLTCTTPWESWIGPFGVIGDLPAVITAPDAALGETGTVTVTFSAHGVAPIIRTAEVTVAEGVDLAAGPSQKINLKPGGTFDASLQVNNNTDTLVHGTAVIFDTDYSFLATSQFSNCFYAGGKVNACTFDRDLQPGATYQIVVPYRLRPDTYAPGNEFGGFGWLTAGDYADRIKFLEDNGYEGPGTAGTGPALELRELPAVSSLAKQTDTNPENNWQELTINVTGNQGTDLAAIGATVSAAVGATAKVPVGARNNGPATLDWGRSGDSPVTVIITVPAGTTVATVPDGCRKSDRDPLTTKPGALQYACFSGTLVPAKTELTWTFGLKISKVIPDAEGAVEVNPPCECSRFDDDINKANDNAAIVLNPTGGAGGGLPITGPQTALLGAAGILLVAGGVAGFVVARRRTRFVA